MLLYGPDVQNLLLLFLCCTAEFCFWTSRKRNWVPNYLGTTGVCLPYFNDNRLSPVSFCYRICFPHPANSYRFVLNNVSSIDLLRFLFSGCRFLLPRLPIGLSPLPLHKTSRTWKLGTLQDNIFICFSAGRQLLKFAFAKYGLMMSSRQQRGAGNAANRECGSDRKQPVKSSTIRRMKTNCKNF